MSAREPSFRVLSITDELALAELRRAIEIDPAMRERSKRDEYLAALT